MKINLPLVKNVQNLNDTGLIVDITHTNGRTEIWWPGTTSPILMVDGCRARLTVNSIGLGLASNVPLVEAALYIERREAEDWDEKGDAERCDQGVSDTLDIAQKAMKQGPFATVSAELKRLRTELADARELLRDAIPHLVGNCHWDGVARIRAHLVQTEKEPGGGE